MGIYAVLIGQFSIFGTENPTKPIGIFGKKLKKKTLVFLILNRFLIFSVWFCGKIRFSSTPNNPSLPCGLLLAIGP